MESLERVNVLAKQVLSQLSYTPTSGLQSFNCQPKVEQGQAIPFQVCAAGNIQKLRGVLEQPRLVPAASKQMAL
jgi:hypothetical protein